MEDKNIELHQQVDKLSSLVMLVNERVNTCQERIRNIKLFSAHLISRLQETPQIASDTKGVLEALPSQCNNTLSIRIISEHSIFFHSFYTYCSAECIGQCWLK